MTLEEKVGVGEPSRVNGQGPQHKRCHRTTGDAPCPSQAVTCARPCLSRVSHHASVGAVGILWPFQLHLQPLHANLEAVHSLDGSLGTSRIVKTHKACQNTRQGTGFNQPKGAPGPHHTQEHCENGHGGWAKVLEEDGGAGGAQCRGLRSSRRSDGVEGKRLRPWQQVGLG